MSIMESIFGKNKKQPQRPSRFGYRQTFRGGMYYGGEGEGSTSSTPATDDTNPLTNTDTVMIGLLPVLNPEPETPTTNVDSPSESESDVHSDVSSDVSSDTGTETDSDISSVSSDGAEDVVPVLSEELPLPPVLPTPPDLVGGRQWKSRRW